jgi:hypothetical protein
MMSLNPNFTKQINALIEWTNLFGLGYRALFRIRMIVFCYWMIDKEEPFHKIIGSIIKVFFSMHQFGVEDVANKLNYGECFLIVENGFFPTAHF